MPRPPADEKPDLHKLPALEASETSRARAARLNALDDLPKGHSDGVHGLAVTRYEDGLAKRSRSAGICPGARFGAYVRRGASRGRGARSPDDEAGLSKRALELVVRCLGRVGWLTSPPWHGMRSSRARGRRLCTLESDEKLARGGGAFTPPGPPLASGELWI